MTVTTHKFLKSSLTAACVLGLKPPWWSVASMSSCCNAVSECLRSADSAPMTVPYKIFSSLPWSRWVRKERGRRGSGLCCPWCDRALLLPASCLLHILIRSELKSINHSPPVLIYPLQRAPRHLAQGKWMQDPGLGNCTLQELLHTWRKTWEKSVPHLTLGGTAW